MKLSLRQQQILFKAVVWLRANLDDVNDDIAAGNDGMKDAGLEEMKPISPTEAANLEMRLFDAEEVILQ